MRKSLYVVCAYISLVCAAYAQPTVVNMSVKDGAGATKTLRADQNTDNSLATHTVPEVAGAAVSVSNPLPVSAAQSGSWNFTLLSMPALPAGTNTIGGVTQTGVWTVQPGNTANTTPWLVSLSGVPAVSQSGVWSFALTSMPSLPTGTNSIGGVTATQTGTWTVQPGNTANTTPWLVSLSGIPAVTQSGAWSFSLTSMPALPTGSNVIGGVTQSGTWNVAVSSLPALPAGTNNIGTVTTSPGIQTQIPLDASTVTTGGTAVTALIAGHRNAGGWIYNPATATVPLCINEITAASGTTTAGSLTCINPDKTYELARSANSVSVISSDSAHPFSGYGFN